MFNFAVLNTIIANKVKLVPANNCDTKSVVVCSVSVHVLVLCVTKQRVEVFTVPTPHQVNGRPVTGLTRSEVVSLLRQAQGDVTLVVSRHEVVDEQDTEEVRPHPLKSCDLWRYSFELKKEIFFEHVCVCVCVCTYTCICVCVCVCVCVHV